LQRNGSRFSLNLCPNLCRIDETIAAQEFQDFDFSKSRAVFIRPSIGTSIQQLRLSHLSLPINPLTEKLKTIAKVLVHPQ